MVFIYDIMVCGFSKQEDLKIMEISGFLYLLFKKFVSYPFLRIFPLTDSLVFAVKLFVIIFLSSKNTQRLCNDVLFFHSCHIQLLGRLDEFYYMVINSIFFRFPDWLLACCNFIKFHFFPSIFSIHCLLHQTQTFSGLFDQLEDWLKVFFWRALHLSLYSVIFNLFWSTLEEAHNCIFLFNDIF